MKSANNKILVKCDLSQKDFMQIGDITLKRANAYDKNYRERSPVLAEVMQDTYELNKGDIILAHHNTFYEPSPYFVSDNIFSIPNNGSIIFAKIESDGTPRAVCGNLIAEEVEITTEYDLPPELRQKYKDRAHIVDGNYGYKTGQLVFTRPSTPYIIVYLWKDIEKRIVKINSSMIIGIAT